MAVLNDYACDTCGHEDHDVWSDSIQDCCGVKMRLLMPHLHSFEWGGPRTYTHIREEPFSSRSELDQWAKDKGMQLGESSEKVGGARNDDYEGMGRTYSYKGASGKDNPLSKNMRRN